MADEVEDFVAEQETSHPGRLAATGRTEDERWVDYHRLQLYDRFSLYFCMRDAEAGEPWEIRDYRITPRGPWTVAIDPYPFDVSPAGFSLVRRVVPKRLRSQAEFPAELFALPSEQLEITFQRV